MKLSKIKIIEASTNKLNALKPQTQFDKLKLTSLQASIQGANMKLKDIADKKMNAAYLQNAINDTAEENGSTTVGLKTVHTQQVKQTANTLLNPTDWYYVRNVEVGTEVPANVVSYRAAVRAECDRLEAAINAATSVEDLINILSTTNWTEL